MESHWLDSCSPGLSLHSRSPALKNDNASWGSSVSTVCAGPYRKALAREQATKAVPAIAGMPAEVVPADNQPDGMESLRMKVHAPSTSCGKVDPVFASAARWVRPQRCAHRKSGASDGSQKCKSTFGSDALAPTTLDMSERMEAALRTVNDGAHRRNPSPCALAYSAAAAVISAFTGTGRATGLTAGALVKRRDRRATVSFRSWRCTTASTMP